jgi:hypothetical protein
MLLRAHTLWLLLLAALPLSAQAPLDPPHELFEREKQIERELAALGERAPQWAGEYVMYYGGLSLAPDSGFAYSKRNCLDFEAFNYGAVTFSGGVVTLHPVLPDQPGHPTPRRLFPIVWGERHYLIAEERMLDFINGVNDGSEPLTPAFLTPFLIRFGDFTKPVSGKPALPEAFREYLLDRPIETVITAVGDRRPFDQHSDAATIVLDAGARAGLKVGMMLYLRRPQARAISARVTRVGDASAEAEAKLYGQHRLEPGWAVSTRLLP